MDSKTGRIVQVASEEDARAQGLIPIPKAELARVAKLSPEERKLWAARRLAMAQPLPGSGAAVNRYESKAERNAVKRQRRSR